MYDLNVNILNLLYCLILGTSGEFNWFSFSVSVFLTSGVFKPKSSDNRQFVDVVGVAELFMLSEVMLLGPEIMKLDQSHLQFGVSLTNIHSEGLEAFTDTDNMSVVDFQVQNSCY